MSSDLDHEAGLNSTRGLHDSGVGLEGWGSPGLLVWGPFSHSVSHQGGCRVARFFNMTVVLFS